MPLTFRYDTAARSVDFAAANAEELTVPEAQVIATLQVAEALKRIDETLRKERPS